MSIVSKALMYEEYGDPLKVLNLKDIKVEKPKAGQVLVKMIASPIHPSDEYTVQGLFPICPPLPAVGGNDGVGKVVECGPGVTHLKVGDLVTAARVPADTWQTHVCCGEKDWFPLDPNIPIPSAAVIRLNPSTAYRLVHDFGNLKPGDYLIQNGATSAVGVYVMQIAKVMGYKTINIFRERDASDKTEDTRRELLSYGADWAVTEKELLSDKHPIHKVLKESPPQLGLECIGGKSGEILMSVLSPTGTFVGYGSMTLTPVSVNVLEMLFKPRVSIRFFNIYIWEGETDYDIRAAMTRELSKWFTSGQIRPSQSERIELADWRKGFQSGSHSDTKPSAIKSKVILYME